MEHMESCPRSILQLAPSPDLLLLDERRLSNLLYRDQLELKHAQLPGLRSEIEDQARNNDVEKGQTAAIQLDWRCKLLISHMLEVELWMSETDGSRTSSFACHCHCVQVAESEKNVYFSLPAGRLCSVPLSDIAQGALVEH